MKVGEKTNFGQIATIFQICSMDADILSYFLKHRNLKGMKFEMQEPYHALVQRSEIFTLTV